MRKGIDYYNRAIALDPNAVDSYGGPSSTCSSLRPARVAARHRDWSARPGGGGAGVAARRGAGRRPRHVGRDRAAGRLGLRRRRPGVRAGDEARAGLALWSLFFRGWLRMAEGRLADARADLQRAVDEFPPSEITLWSLGLSFYFDGQYDAAIEQYRRAIGEEPDSYWAHLSLGWAYGRQGRVADAIKELELTRRLLDTPQVVAALAHAQAAAGRRVEAQATMTLLLEYAKRKYVCPYDLATASAGLGDRTETLAWLEKAYEERCGWLALWLKIDPTFDWLRTDDRFREPCSRASVTRRERSAGEHDSTRARRGRRQHRLVSPQGVRVGRSGRRGASRRDRARSRERR